MTGIVLVLFGLTITTHVVAIEIAAHRHFTITAYAEAIAAILVSFVTAGVILSAIGLYKPVADFAGAGASVPLTGFGHALAEGVREGVREKGLLGAFTGGVTRTAGGIAAAVIFGYLCALLAKPKAKT